MEESATGTAGHDCQLKLITLFIEGIKTQTVSAAMADSAEQTPFGAGSSRSG